MNPLKAPLEKERKTIIDLVDDNYDIILAFLVPILIMVLLFIQRNIFPFGDETFLRTDMYHQYAPFYSELHNKLVNGGSLYYSWNIGLGVNFLALIAYYLASPFNILLYLVPKEYIIEFMTGLVVLKIGLSSMAMTYYLKKHCNTKNAGTALFGILYGLSGYMAAYSWNIMWLDCIVLFPIIMLGLERLVKEKKGGLYCIALGLSIFSNYYISSMTCIFCVLYFGVLLILEKDHSGNEVGKSILRFSAFSLIAGGISAVVLLPEISALQMAASADVNFPNEMEDYFSILEILGRHLANVEIEIGLDHWPNIYCGIFVLILIPLYFMSQKVTTKEKTLFGILLFLLIASFSINVFNFIWHGLRFPNSLPARHSYIYIFLVLVMAYKAYIHLKEYKKKHIASAFWGSIGFILVLQTIVDAEHFEFHVYYVAIIFLVLYLWLALWYRKEKRYWDTLFIVALGIVSIESGMNATVTSVTTTGRSAYLEDNEAVADLVGTIIPGDTFTRFEKISRKTKNDGAWMNFPSVSLFSSTTNADVTDFIKRMGCEGATNSYSITGATPFVDTLLSVGYGIYSEEVPQTGLRTYANETQGTWLYENVYTLPLGFMVPLDFEMSWDIEQGTPAEVQNRIAQSIGGMPVLVDEVKPLYSGEEAEWSAWESGEYYAYVTNKDVKKVKVTIGDTSKTHSNLNRGFFMELGYVEAGTNMKFEVQDANEDMEVSIFRFSEEGLIRFYEVLNESPWKITTWTDTMIKGTVAVKEDGILYTSIPFDSGWKIMVNGTEYQGEKILDTFLGIQLNEGTYEIVMEYTPDGLYVGGSITFISFLLLGGYWFICKRKDEKELEESDIDEIEGEDLSEPDMDESKVEEIEVLDELEEVEEIENKKLEEEKLE